MKNLMIWCVAGIAVTLAAGCGIRTPSSQQNADEVLHTPVQPTKAGKASDMPVQKTIELGGDTKLEMVLIPAGSFVMGDNLGLDDEKPVHKVTITKTLYLGQYEVTVEQFRRFVEATGYVTDAEKGTGFQGAFGWNRDTMEFKMNEEYSWRSTGQGLLICEPQRGPTREPPPDTGLPRLCGGGVAERRAGIPYAARPSFLMFSELARAVGNPAVGSICPSSSRKAEWIQSPKLSGSVSTKVRISSRTRR